VHRWAYRLASVDGSLQVVAKAVVAGCADAVEAAEAEHAYVEGAPGLPLSPQAVSKALFYLAQARAGRCAIP
jgi:hypothetical protein